MNLFNAGAGSGMVRPVVFHERVANEEVIVLHSHGVTSHKENMGASQMIRNPAEYPILGILLLGPMHGYDMCRQLGEGIGPIWRLGKSQIYALLAKLEREGLVTRERVGQENLPAKNIFSLTHQGHQLFKVWATNPVRHMRDMRLEFLTKLWFARRLGAESEKDLITAQLSECQERIDKLEISKQACKTEIEARCLEFRVVTIRAAISWLEGLSEAIGSISDQR